MTIKWLGGGEYAKKPAPSATHLTNRRRANDAAQPSPLQGAPGPGGEKAYFLMSIAPSSVLNLSRAWGVRS
jgi:hypothetical protein